MNAKADAREDIAAFLMRMRAAGIDDRALFAAIEATPRPSFIPSQWQEVAWSGRMIPIECGEAIEGLDLQAAVIKALDLSSGLRVLELGTGSGFTAAVMARLAARVLTLERFRTLTELAAQRFEALGVENVIARHADASEGAAADGPFDRIVSWCAFAELPRAFADQLSTNGVMIAPLGAADDVQTMVKLTKVGSRFEREEVAAVRLQPFVEGKAVAI